MRNDTHATPFRGKKKKKEEKRKKYVSSPAGLCTIRGIRRETKFNGLAETRDPSLEFVFRERAWQFLASREISVKTMANSGSSISRTIFENRKTRSLSKEKVEEEERKRDVRFSSAREKSAPLADDNRFKPMAKRRLKEKVE